MAKSFYSVREENGAGDQGTDSLVNKYKSETPGQGESGDKKQKPRKGDMLGNKDEPAGTIKEAKSKASDALRAYAKKSGGIDKKDFMVLAGKLDNFAGSGNPGVVADVAKMLRDMDTDPRDKAIEIMMKNDPAMARSVMRKAGLKEEVELEENANVDYKASSEKSQFGGYRAKLVNPQGKTSYLGSTSYKTPKAAEGEAAAYRDGYFGGPGKANERGANRMVDAYKKKNAKDLYKKESIEIDEGLEVKLRGGKVPVGQHKLIYKTSKSAKYIENSLKARDKDAEVTQKGNEVHATASAQAHSGLIASLRKFGENGIVTEGNMGRDEKSRAKNDANRLANAKVMAKHKFANKKPVKEEVELDEAMKYTDKQIKMAYGIINDPRYKSGNMTAIVKKIEQIARGLSKHPGVQKAIRVTNEDVEYNDDLILETLDQLIEAYDDENYEENSMAVNQCKFIQYAAEEIMEVIEEDMEDMPEWFQNKLTKAFVEMQALHSYAEAQRYEEDEEEMDEYYESTQAYGNTMRKQAADRQQKMMKPGEMDKLRKLRQMLDKEKKK